MIKVSKSDFAWFRQYVQSSAKVSISSRPGERWLIGRPYGRVIKVEMSFLDTFSMIPLGIGETEEPLFQKVTGSR